jgi:hypothetical protein
MLGRCITEHEYKDLLARAQSAPERWLELEPEAMREHYNRLPFAMRHRLAEHPLMQWSELMALCRRMPPREVRYRFGDIAPDADFDMSYSQRYREGLTLDDALDNLEARRAYVCVYNPESDPVYRPFLEQLLAEFAVATQPLDPHITWFSTYVFITAQGAITPYHMDREMNFLMQVRGSKTAYLWDQADPVIMSAAQKDQMLAYVGRKPQWLPEFEPKAMRFELTPGVGVHHPFIAPHRVHTGPELSVSLAFTFRTRWSDRQTLAHQLNWKLRQRGLRPGEIGRHAVVDAAKAGVLGLARKTYAGLCRLRGIDTSAALPD